MFQVAPFTRTPLSSFSPYFRVRNWEDPTLIPLMQEMVDMAALEPGWSDFGWSRANDRLFWRSAFEDDLLMADSFARVQPIFDRMLAGPLALDRFEFGLPSSRMARLSDTTRRLARAFDPTFFSTEDLPVESAKGYFRREISGPEGVHRHAKNQVTVKPEFAISDWSLAEPLMLEMMDVVAKQPGCVDFQWNKAEDKLQARGTFADGPALKRYMEESKPILDKMDKGPAKVQQLEFHGPPLQLEAVKTIAPAEFNPQFFEHQAIEAKKEEPILEIKAPPQEARVEASAPSTAT